jgi:hypothetical protein
LIAARTSWRNAFMVEGIWVPDTALSVVR